MHFYVLMRLLRAIHFRSLQVYSETGRLSAPKTFSVVEELSSLEASLPRHRSCLDVGVDGLFWEPFCFDEFGIRITAVIVALAVVFRLNRFLELKVAHLRTIGFGR
jgi:hypothetical protein